MAIVSFSKMHINSRGRLLENNLHAKNKKKKSDAIRIRTCDRENKSTSASISYRRY